MELHMEKEAIDAIVEQVLARIGKSTLMVLTPANGYHQEIASGLESWKGIRWNIISNQSSEQELKAVGHLGHRVHWDGMNPSQWLDQYEHVLFPFLDIATLGEVTNGLYLTQASQLFQYALMKGISIYALNYQCDLNSELNQVLGFSSNIAMCERNALQLEQVNKLGATVGSLINIKQAMLGVEGLNEPIPQLTPGYITLSEVKKKGIGMYTLQDNLTDLAAEYIKENKRQ